MGMARRQDNGARQPVCSSHSPSLPAWAVSSTLDVRSRSSRGIFELEIVCFPALYTFRVIAGLMSSGNVGIQPDYEKLEVKSVLTSVVWR